MSEVKTGRVKFYNTTKGFGFISEDESENEYFVHATGITENTKIDEDDVVSFELVEGRKGLNCTNVTLI